MTRKRIHKNPLTILHFSIMIRIHHMKRLPQGSFSKIQWLAKTNLKTSRKQTQN